MDQVKNIVVVMSGKGGVGKSTLAVQIAHGIHRAGNKVGVMDVDLCGPSIPAMFGVDKGHDVMRNADNMWIPVVAPASGGRTISLMSIAFLIGKNDPVVWKGPKKTAFIKDNLLAMVDWGELDYLVIDTPPGTSDEHFALITHIRRLPNCKAVLVTTPQMASIGDVRRELQFCRKIQLEICGIIENMSGYVCPHCSECTNIFSTGGGEQLAREKSIEFLGRVPIDSRLARVLDVGGNFDEEFNNKDNDCWRSIDNVVKNIVKNYSG